jgi:hypothetical protein
MTFVVDKNSWHFRWLAYSYMIRNLKDFNERNADRIMMNAAWKQINPVMNAETYFSDRGYMPYEFCSYWRQVLLWPALGVLTSFSLLACSVYFLSFASSGIILTISGTFLAIGLLMAGLFAAAVGGAAGIAMIKDKATNSDSFFVAMYKSYKNKVCPNVEYKKDVK